ncbi:hypothetical protein Hypma_001248 [Hypsizygus marmoreus]|uniref:Uncharacterized protein n=1 Tax=Hypsizygus marmoreus TaxID=39966 RepID=A0A369J647_HYPMA|nr:hypothetical protein Hypma_001248 [Hypsizygus marmoreus]
MAIGENIIVNDFMFCQDHGDELCHICCCDHRMTNNIRIEKDLSDMEEFFEFEAEERQPLNAYALGAVAAVTTESSYECEAHHKVDCAKCFDWVGIIKKEAEAAEEQGRWLTKRNSLMDRTQLESACQYIAWA